MKCPLCKHEPNKKKNGSLRMGEIDFDKYRIDRSVKGGIDTYGTYDTVMMFSCPKCGIMFVETEVGGEFE